MPTRPVRLFVLGTLAYLLVLEAMLWAAIQFWPDFEANIGGIKLLTRLPVVKGLLGVLKEGELPGYVTFQHFFKDCNLLGTLAAVLFAVGAVAGEAHRGTLEILLARPQSRLRVVLERWIAGAFAVVAPVFLSTWTIPWLLERQDETLPLAPLMLGAVHQSCMLLAVFALTFLVSTVGRNPVRIAIAMLFLATFELATYFVMEATHGSVVRLVDPRHFVEIFGTGRLDWGICGPLLGFAGVCAVLSAVCFRFRTP